MDFVVRSQISAIVSAERPTIRPSASDIFREVGLQRLRDQSGQGHARLDRAELDLLDQLDRQIHIELFDVVLAHAAMLAY